MKNPIELAYNTIKQNILDGIYLPSQRLTENELSKTIGVSRNTIKKALLKLEQENLVQIEHHKGAFVKSYTLEEVVNYLEIREALEGVAIKSAAERMTDAELEQLDSILKDMEYFLESNEFDKYSSCNKKFHNIIYNASTNVEAVKMINIIKTQLMRQHFRTIFVPGRKEQSIKEHRDIYLALKQHDPMLAQEAIQKHVGNIKETIKENFAILS